MSNPPHLLPQPEPPPTVPVALASNGNVVMMIFLGKNLLKQRDKTVEEERDVAADKARADRQVGDPGSPSQIRTTSGSPPLVAARRPRYEVCTSRSARASSAWQRERGL
jgi:hypothetical protein